MLLSELLTADRVRVPLGSRTKDEILRELVELAVGDRGAAVIDAVLGAVREREAVLSTGIGGGVAIPHGKTPAVDGLIMAAGVAGLPVEFDSLDAQPAELFFLLIGPESASGAHVKALSRISRLLRRETLRQALRESASSAEFLQVVRTSEAA